MFRFTIRDVLWLTLLVATSLGMSLAWRKDHAAWQRDRIELQVTKARLQTVEENLEELKKGLTHLAMLKEMVVSAEADRLLRDHNARQAASSQTEPNP